MPLSLDTLPSHILEQHVFPHVDNPCSLAMTCRRLASVAHASQTKASWLVRQFPAIRDAVLRQAAAARPWANNSADRFRQSPPPPSPLEPASAEERRVACLTRLVQRDVLALRVFSARTIAMPLADALVAAWTGLARDAQADTDAALAVLIDRIILRQGSPISAAAPAVASSLSSSPSSLATGSSPLVSTHSSTSSSQLLLDSDLFCNAVTAALRHSWTALWSLLLEDVEREENAEKSSAYSSSSSAAAAAATNSSSQKKTITTTTSHASGAQLSMLTIKKACVRDAMVAIVLRNDEASLTALIQCLHDRPEIKRQFASWESFVLLKAIYERRPSLVQCMLQLGVPAHPPKFKGALFPGLETPMVAAAKTNQREVARMLLAHGADPTDAKDGLWPTVAAYGDVELLRELIQRSKPGQVTKNISPATWLKLKQEDCTEILALLEEAGWDGFHGWTEEEIEQERQMMLDEERMMGRESWPLPFES